MFWDWPRWQLTLKRLPSWLPLLKLGLMAPSSRSFQRCSPMHPWFVVPGKSMPWTTRILPMQSKQPAKSRSSSGKSRIGTIYQRSCRSTSLTIGSGVLTEVCVAFPALSLIEQGYDVFVVTDASGTFKEHTREAAHKRMVQAGCQLLNWAAVGAELHRDWRRDIEGFGAIWNDYVPGYRCLTQSYMATKDTSK